MKGETGIRLQAAPSRGSSRPDGRAEELHKQEVIWGNNPNQHYFAYFIENRHNVTGKTDDGSTLEEILAGPRKALAARQIAGSLASEANASSVQSTVPSELSVSSAAQMDGDQDLVPVPSPKFSTPPPRKTPQVRSPRVTAGDDIESGRHQGELPPFIYVGDSPLTVRVQHEDSIDEVSNSKETVVAFHLEGCRRHAIAIMLVALVFCLLGIAAGVVLFLRA